MLIGAAMPARAATCRALHSYTIWAARQLFIEKETGTLERGKFADISSGIAIYTRFPRRS
jgi:predicted amidohydrolase YtcJ